MGEKKKRGGAGREREKRGGERGRTKYTIYIQYYYNKHSSPLSSRIYDHKIPSFFYN